MPVWSFLRNQSWISYFKNTFFKLNDSFFQNQSKTFNIPQFSFGLRRDIARHGERRKSRLFGLPAHHWRDPFPKRSDFRSMICRRLPACLSWQSITRRICRRSQDSWARACHEVCPGQWQAYNSDFSSTDSNDRPWQDPRAKEPRIPSQSQRADEIEKLGQARAKLNCQKHAMKFPVHWHHVPRPMQFRFHSGGN